MLQIFRSKGGMRNIVNHEGAQCDRAKCEGRCLKLSLNTMKVFIFLPIFSIKIQVSVFYLADGLPWFLCFEALFFDIIKFVGFSLVLPTSIVIPQYLDVFFSMCTSKCEFSLVSSFFHSSHQIKPIGFDKYFVED